MQLKNDKGFTLIELMVAITLGLILILGVVELFAANKLTYTKVNNISSMNENGLYSMHQIKRLIMHAGYYNVKARENGPDFSAINGNDANYIPSWRVEEVLKGLNNYDNGMGYAESNTKPGSDVLFIRFDAGDEGVFGCGGVLHQNKKVYQTIYLDNNNQLNCITNVTGQASQTLVVAENVAEFQLQYGVDSNGNGQVNNYVDIPGDWKKVLAVKVGILVSNDKDVRSLNVNNILDNNVALGQNFKKGRLFVTSYMLRNKRK
ncbi:PilW family protein [Zooshikella ganghwensis]|uniref:Prepilin-type N-terminal cleavage/methylation domain-containing protein n=1 Tax=Zooshikella ganghwensis TaxID=202772 RepID=A0A4P9VUC2_9GAMM|nr:PilW family protein [Zooshikella ganghwensis]RDH45510.1 prepilin-type N-terminal cleavage/methylation domain-containing protein [Zooshikella ganghwensis]